MRCACTRRTRACCGSTWTIGEQGGGGGGRGWMSGRQWWLPQDLPQAGGRGAHLWS
jgi:hypothetical protein